MSIADLKALSKNIIDTGTGFYSGIIMLVKVIALVYIQNLIHKKVDKQLEKERLDWENETSSNTNVNVNV